MKYTVEDFGTKTALENMADDFFLLENLNEPLLRFYRFSSLSVTHGYFLDPLQFLKMPGIAKHKLQIAKRPTGGGLIFHGFDFTFSLLIPIGHPDFVDNVLESYHMINKKVITALQAAFNVAPTLLEGRATSSRPGFCMAKPTVYDVLLREKKIGGAAQRRTKKGLLHQSSINLQKIGRPLLEELLQDMVVIDEMEACSEGLGITCHEDLKNILIKSFC